jgi:hypothetical protein
VDCSLFIIADDGDFTERGLTIWNPREHLLTPVVPITTRLLFVSGFIAYPHEFGQRFKLNFRIVDEDGKVIKDHESDYTVKTQRASRIVHSHRLDRIYQITFESAGIHEFSLLINDELKSSFPLELIKVDQ